MNAERAFDLASSWGSYMHAGDPGACFYGFALNDGRPASPLHRSLCLNYTFDLIKELRDDRPEEKLDAEEAADLAELRELWDWFATCPLVEDEA